MVKKLALLMGIVVIQQVYSMEEANKSFCFDDLPIELKSYILALIPQLGGYTDIGNLITVNKEFHDICLTDHYVLDSFVPELIEKVPEKAERLLLRAIKNGNNNLTNAFIKSGVNVDAENNGFTAVMSASFFGYYELTGLLIKKGANINLIDKQGNTALLLAVLNNQLAIAELLISHGSDVNIRNKYDYSALAIAVRNVNVPMIKLLIDHHAQLNINLPNNIPLLLLAQWNYEVIQLLIENGADVNAQTHDGVTPLKLAMFNKAYDIVELLVQSGAEGRVTIPVADREIANYDADGETESFEEHPALSLSEDDDSYVSEEEVTHMSLEDREALQSSVTERKKNSSEDRELKNLAEELIQQMPELAKELFFIAIYSDYRPLIGAFISAGIDVNCKDSNGKDSLVCRLLADEQSVRLFISSSSDAKEEAGLTPLIWAVLTKNYELAKLLTSCGADINGGDNKGRTALMWSVLTTNYELAELVISCGADINAQENDGFTALMMAVSGKNYDLVRLLLEHHVDSTIIDNFGRSVVTLACELGLDDIVQILNAAAVTKCCPEIDKFADIISAGLGGQRGNSALYQNIEQFLNINKTRKRTIVDTDLDSLLILLIKDRPHLAKDLFFKAIKHDVLSFVYSFCGQYDMRMRDKDGSTPLLCAIHANNEYLTNLFLRKDADVNAKNYNGETGLIVATQKGFKKIAKLMIDRGANTGAKDKSGWTSLMIAAKNGDVAMTKYLIKKKASVNAANKLGWTPLMISCQEGNDSIVNLLLSNNANANAQNNMGMTALMIATQYGHQSLASMLIASSDINAIDHKSWTALDFAYYYEHALLVEILEEHGAQKGM